MEADEDACDVRHDRQRYCDGEGVVEAFGDELGADAGGNQHGDDEDDTDGLHGADSGEGQHDEQAGVQEWHGKAGEAGLGFVEDKQHVVAPFAGEDEEHQRADDDDLPALRGQHAEEVAEEDVGEVLVAVAVLEEEDAGGEEGGEGDAEQGVALQGATPFEPAGSQGAGESGGEGTRDERQAEDGGDDDAGQDGVRDGVAHQRPAFEDDVAGEQGAGDAEQQGDGERLLHEGVLQGVGEDVHGRWRRAARCCRRRTVKTTRKRPPCRTTTTAPVLPLTK